MHNFRYYQYKIEKISDYNHLNHYNRYCKKIRLICVDKNIIEYVKGDTNRITIFKKDIKNSLYVSPGMRSHKICIKYVIGFLRRDNFALKGLAEVSADEYFNCFDG